jgi:hypothetical protein
LRGAIYGLSQFLNRRAVRRVVAAELEEQAAGVRDKEVSATLRHVVAARPLQTPAIPKQLEILPYDSRGEELPPGQLAKLERLIDTSLWVGVDSERPLLFLLIGAQSFRGREGCNDDVDSPRCKPCALFRHLPEVFLAGESGEMTKEDHERRSLNDVGHGNRDVVERE